jgi:hypothetical protein
MTANCGCVYHAEEGIPCEHDRAEQAALEALQRAYIELLRMPHGGMRARNQEALATLRDAISKETGIGGQEVQDSFEAMELKLRLGLQ